MSYKELYERFSGEAGYIKRSVYRDAVQEITGINKITHMRTGMDISVSRGCFLKATNVEHELVQAWGGNIIITARGMNRCWERFVYCKELMHVFSQGDDCTDNGAAFEILMTELSGPPTVGSAPYTDEIESFWRALALICPEKRRQEFIGKLQANEISEYDVALQLKIPELYVSRLFWPRFDEFLIRNDLK